MREKGSWKQESFRARSAEVKARGSATFEGEDRVRQGKGLDSLVDPKARGVIRYANNLLVPDGDEFVLEFGPAMPVKTDSDTTASMGYNVDTFFAVQPKVQNLLIQGKNAVLKRYHAQMSTGSIGDRLNQFPYQSSQYEPDNEVERQMGLLAPERNGGYDTTEDYQLSLFSAAYLTKASIWEYGLKGYYFPLGDERGRDTLEAEILERVFGPEVYEKAFGKKPQRLPDTEAVVREVLTKWHTFFLQVTADVSTTRNAAPWWSKMIGRERVVVLQRTEDLAEVQAVIIGLTEGLLDLQSAVDFLRESNVSAADAERIVKACEDIPIGAQAQLPNFSRIPKVGDRFASRDDIWPIGKGAKKKRAKKATEKDWQV